ncbi:MAG: hypothetical protein SPL53_09640 [Bacteroidales bacterium]|nr:hypothetical protein [Bacteroidales bacterium]
MSFFPHPLYSPPRGLKAGGKYQVFVVDDNADPIALDGLLMPPLLVSR